jgi:hypothetical protein
MCSSSVAVIVIYNSLSTLQNPVACSYCNLQVLPFSSYGILVVSGRMRSSTLQMRHGASLYSWYVCRDGLLTGSCDGQIRRGAALGLVLLLCAAVG